MNSVTNHRLDLIKAPRSNKHGPKRPHTDTEIQDPKKKQILTESNNQLQLIFIIRFLSFFFDCFH